MPEACTKFAPQDIEPVTENEEAYMQELIKNLTRVAPECLAVCASDCGDGTTLGIGIDPDECKNCLQSNSACTVIEACGECINDHDNSFNQLVKNCINKYFDTPWPSDGDDDGLSTGAIVGISIASAIVLIAIIVVVFLKVKG